MDIQRGGWRKVDGERWMGQSLAQDRTPVPCHLSPQHVIQGASPTPTFRTLCRARVPSLMRIWPQTLSLPLHPTPEWLTPLAGMMRGTATRSASLDKRMALSGSHLNTQKPTDGWRRTSSPSLLCRPGGCEAILSGSRALEPQQQEEQSL